jgi:hypothetical protein
VRGVSITALTRRLEALEALAGEGGGCERCRGTLVVVRDAVSGKLWSASWNGKRISEEDLREREVETECPRCGARIEPGEGTVIEVGGRGPHATTRGGVCGREHQSQDPPPRR